MLAYKMCSIQFVLLTQSVTTDNVTMGSLFTSYAHVVLLLLQILYICKWNIQNVTNCENKKREEGRESGKNTESKTINPLLMACIYSSLQLHIYSSTRVSTASSSLNEKLQATQNTLIHLCHKIWYHSIASQR